MDICILIVGNKSDLKAKKLVQTSDAAKFAQNNGVDFIETSAFTGENVNECFKMLTSAVLSKIESGRNHCYYYSLIYCYATRPNELGGRQESAASTHTSNETIAER